MATTTPAQGFRVPQASDDPNVAEDMTNLALDIEKRVVGRYATSAARNTAVPSPVDGQVALIADTRAITVYNAGTSTWQTVFPQAIPSFTSGTSVPSNGSGADGDVYFKTTTNPDALVPVNWNAATNLNGWSNYGSGQAPLRYVRINGIVYVEGTCNQGTLSAPACQLPVGYRPNAGIIFTSVSGNLTAGAVNVTTAGNVVPLVAVSGFNIAFSFPADQ